ncbi:MAG: HD-GYP domain-containing protein, partial [Pseudomonadota bacterium]
RHLWSGSDQRIAFVEQLKLPADELIKGMYVSQLDRPWTETPFLFQGFKIRDTKDINQLQKYCKFVYIDVERGKSPPPATGRPPMPDNIPKAPLPKPSVKYEDETAVEKEVEVAQAAQVAVTQAVDCFMDDVRAGKKPDYEQLKQTVVRMEESVLRNPDAFMWLRRLKDKDSYSYAHCIDTSMLAIAFGRQLGLPRVQIRSLGIGALLSDVGKMRLPSELLTKQGRLTDEEFDLVKTHVEHSVKIMKELPDVPDSAISIAATHHERFDGSGYPRGLAGGDIPLHGRMTAIVDCFDAMTSDRPYAQAVSPHEVIQQMYQWRNTAFQDELVEQFIQTLGVYPVGTLVELNTGEVGIVIGQNRVRRLRPKVMLVLDKYKTALEITPIRDLLTEEYNEDGTELTIVRSLEPNAYGIDPAEYYL